MKTKKEQKKERKPRKKEGRVAKVFRLHQKGLSVKQIAEKTNLSERVVRSYIWRAANPEKYKVLLQRYFAKKRLKQENETIKAAVKNQNSEKQRREERKG